jgi:hypothetical protein
MVDAIEILVGDVNDVYARVYARYLGEDAERIELSGTLRGPICESARTLPANIAFRDAGKPGQVEALIPDPCTWSPDLPHLYQADVTARHGDQTLAEYHGTIGLRRVQDE